MGELKCSKDARVYQNVTFRVIDKATGQCVQEVVGHNQATNTMLEGIGNYLAGNGIFNQGYAMLSDYVPRYISLGTMGLRSQAEDAAGLPDIDPITYMQETPGYGADGYDASLNNDRAYFGLGPKFADRPQPTKTVDCELISDSFGRTTIQQRRVLPEIESEVDQTLDVIFSAMISTGALAQFREPGSDHIFITEAGLWSQRNSTHLGDGLLAGYRIVPPNTANWDMSDPGNVDILRRQILRVGINQVVQVIWKVQLGSLKQLLGGEEPALPSVTVVKMRYHAYNIGVGGSHTIDVTVTTSDPDVHVGVRWSSSNTDVAVVDSTGTVSTVGLGTAIITATANDGSGASDSCTVVASANTSDPLGPVMSTDLCISGKAAISAGVQVGAVSAHIRQGIDWAASSDPSGTWGAANGQLFISEGSNGTAIHTGGGNEFLSDIYKGATLNIVSDDPAETADPSTFLRGNVSALPLQYSFPEIRPLMYASGTNIIPTIPGASIIINEGNLQIISDIDYVEANRRVSVTISDGRVISGYLQYILPSESAGYGKYGQLTLECTETRPVNCYVEFGTYAFGSINLLGDYCTFEFLPSADPYYSPFCTLFAVNSSLYLPEHTNVVGTNRVILYSGGNVTISNVSNAYVLAPNGEVTVNAGDSTAVAKIYANRLVCNSDVSPF